MLKVVGSYNSSSANNDDSSSQLGHIFFSGDAPSKVVLIRFKSYKSRRVTRSAMSGEVISLSYTFHVAISIAQ